MTPNMLPTGTVFGAIAIIFVGVALRDYLMAEKKMTPARSTYLRIAFIFAGICIALTAMGWWS